MRLAKKIPSKILLQEQVENLKRRVIIKHPDFKDKTGIIGSIKLYNGYYIILDESYRVKDDFYSRVKHFNEKYIKLI